MAWGLLLAPLVVPGWAGKTIPLAILFFVGDFFRSWYYRKDLFRRSLAVLRHMAETGQLHEARNNQILSQIDDTTGPPPEDRSADIREALTGVELNGKDVLHLGCGGAGEADINGVYLSGGARLMGVDIFVPFVKAFRAHFSPHAVLADALRLPFQKESVDIVNCTDIIEHVHDPKRFLQENLRIMKPGGFLLIITPNSCRARGSLDILNPLSLAASIWGSHQPQCRFPGRDLLGFYGNYVFYHTSYTARGLRDLIESSGLECRYVRVRAYRGGAKRWRRLLEKWPGVRWANDSLFALARKPVLPKK
jgi:SAM-dependent methyltransferase